MKKTILVYVVTIAFGVAFVEPSEGKLDQETVRKELISYVNRMAGTSLEELNEKDYEELLDMAISSVQWHIEESKNIGRTVLLEAHLKFYQGLKDEYNGITPAPVVDAAHTVDDEDDFDERVQNAGDKLVLVDFFATWCRPCYQIAPKLEEFAKKYESQLVVLKVDVDQESGLAMGRFSVSKLPTFVFLKNGKEIERSGGADEVIVENIIKRLIE